VDDFYTGSRGEAEAAMVEATGSVAAAERLLRAMERYPREEAEALPRYIQKAAQIPPAYEDGRPADSYKEQIKAAAFPTQDERRRERLPGSALFDEVADDLLYRLDERLGERIEEIARAVLDGRGGGKAEVLRQEANTGRWTHDDLVLLMRRAWEGETGRGGEDTALLALARDAMREVAYGAVGRGGRSVGAGEAE